MGTREMKDSGIEWIGEIPKDWSVKRLKYSCKIFGRIGFRGYTTDDLVNENEGAITLSPSNIIDMKMNYEKCSYISWYKYNESPEIQISPSDVLLVKTGSSFGKCSFVDYIPKECTINPQIVVFKEHLDNPKFFTYFFQTPIAKYFIDTSVVGGTIPTISQQKILNYVFLFPPLYEQHLIATFLDEKCKDIDTLITLQEEMIAELQAYKQSVISEAVTKGLNPNVPMKDSGVEWIGEIPEGWEIVPLKRLCKEIKDGAHFSPSTTSTGYSYVTAGDVHGKGVDFIQTRKISEKDYLDLCKSGCKSEKDDVLLVKDGATTGRVGLMTEDYPCVLLSSVAMLRTEEYSTPYFLYYLLMSDLIQKQISIAMAGSAMPRITLTKINKFLGILLPLSEQRQIADYLDAKCAQIDELIALKQQKITELQDYKKSLIYEYVTGKKEVPANN